MNNTLETTETPAPSLPTLVATLAAYAPKSVYKLLHKPCASALGIKPHDLYQLVTQERAKIAKGSQEQVFVDPEPWDEPVEIISLLEELKNLLNKFIVLPTHADIILSAWVIFTWCIDAFDVAPILSLYSPEKGCGKTTLIGLLTDLVKRAMPSSNCTAAPMFRMIEAYQPTIMLDEADTFLAQSEELRSIINAGHKRKMAFVLRSEGQTHTPKKFSTFSAKCIALIGHLPDTLHDRAIVVRLRRILQTEEVSIITPQDEEMFKIIRRKLARFAKDNSASIRQASMTASIPKELYARSKDNWLPFLTLASLTDADWSTKMTEAALSSLENVNDVMSVGLELLIDIKSIVADVPLDKRVLSADVIEALCNIEDKPWAKFKNNKPITTRQLSDLLKPYGIKPIDIYYEGKGRRGYHVSHFTEVFASFIPSGPENHSTEAQEN
jgi:putative DNA primase/helicase